MKIIKRTGNKVKLVRVIIGNTQTGQANIKKPIYSLTIECDSSKKVYDKIVGLLENEGK